MQLRHFLLQLVHVSEVLEGRVRPKQSGISLWQSMQALVHFWQAVDLFVAELVCSQRVPPYLKQYDGLPMRQA